MRRTLLLFAVVALLLAMVTAPAAAYPKNSTLWDTACDMNGDGDFDTYFVQAADYQPGWMVEPVAIKAPAIWFGGHVDVHVNGVLDPNLSADIDPPLGMEGRLTTCMQEATVLRGDATWHIVWDPLYLFFSPPAVP